MSGHLPECDTPNNGLLPCICEALRACEQRVHGWQVSAAHALGFDAGLSAARDAVAALPVESRGIGMKDDALAAIDALRGDAPEPHLPDGYKPTQTVESATFSGGIRLPWGKRGGDA